MILAMMAMAADTAGTPATVYFPPDYTQPRIICDPMRPDRREPALDGRQITSYRLHLTAAQEPTLAPAEKRTAGTPDEVLRFTWLPSFHPPVFVRVETRGKTSRLIAKTLRERRGSADNGVARTAERDLTATELRDLKALVKASDLDSLPAKQCMDEGVQLDGANWLFEHAGPRDYRLVERWNPNGAPLRALGEYMLKLTGWEFTQID